MNRSETVHRPHIQHQSCTFQQRMQQSSQCQWWQNVKVSQLCLKVSWCAPLYWHTLFFISQCLQIEAHSLSTTLSLHHFLSPLPPLKECGMWTPVNRSTVSTSLLPLAAWSSPLMVQSSLSPMASSLPSTTLRRKFPTKDLSTAGWWMEVNQY